MPALIGGANRNDAFNRARKLIEYLGLKDRESHRPAQLSGGERQRAAVARALINNPKVVLADEPSGSLDTKNRQELHKLFFDLRRDMNQTFVIVTHDESLAADCDRIIKMRDGQITEIISNKKYGRIIHTKASLDNETKNIVKKNIRAMFMHKIGYVLVNTVDSVIISAFVGIVSLGEYSNYTMVLSSMSGILTLIFTSLTSVIGHLCVEEDKETSRKYCESFHLLNFMIGTIFFLGYYAVIDSLVSVLFSAELIVDKSVSFVITLNGFVQFMRRSTLTFKDATGSFYQDRWKPLVEGITNIILSIILVKLIGVAGVIAATIITNLLICHAVEPYVLYKNAFNVSPKRFFMTNYGMILLFTLSLMGLNFCLQTVENSWVELVLNGFISVGVSVTVCIVVALLKRSQASQLVKMFKKG
jgi:energy-coupling factor transporter ATP-binding protein EcfA2